MFFYLSSIVFMWLSQIENHRRLISSKHVRIYNNRDWWLAQLTIQSNSVATANKLRSFCRTFCPCFRLICGSFLHNNQVLHFPLLSSYHNSSLLWIEPNTVNSRVKYAFLFPKFNKSRIFLIDLNISKLSLPSFILACSCQQLACCFNFIVPLNTSLSSDFDTRTPLVQMSVGLIVPLTCCHFSTEEIKTFSFPISSKPLLLLYDRVQPLQHCLPLSPMCCSVNLYFWVFQLSTLCPSQSQAGKFLQILSALLLEQLYTLADQMSNHFHQHFQPGVSHYKCWFRRRIWTKSWINNPTNSFQVLSLEERVGKLIDFFNLVVQKARPSST